MSDLARNDENLLKLLLDGEFMSEQEAELARHHAEKTGEKVAQAVVNLAIMPDEQVGVIVADMEGIPFVKF